MDCAALLKPACSSVLLEAVLCFTGTSARTIRHTRIRWFLQVLPCGYGCRFLHRNIRYRKIGIPGLLPYIITDIVAHNSPLAPAVIRILTDRTGAVCHTAEYAAPVVCIADPVHPAFCRISVLFIKVTLLENTLHYLQEEISFSNKSNCCA